MHFGDHAVFHYWTLFLNGEGGRKAEMAHEPILREVCQPQEAGRKEDAAFVSPEVELQSLTLPASRILALLSSTVSPSAWHRAWHMQGAPGISVE